MPLSPSTADSIFNIIKGCLQKFAPPMVVSKDKEGVFEIMGNKAVPYGSKKVMVPGMYFSSVVIRKEMVSFYFFPLYYHPEEFLPLIPTLSRTLKGKTCFNIKKLEQVNEKELIQLFQKGVKAWIKLGYMKEEVTFP